MSDVIQSIALIVLSGALLVVFEQLKELQGKYDMLLRMHVRLEYLVATRGKKDA